MSARGAARPVMRYHGGKWRIAPWIISHFPAHRIYVEPYGGAGSVLLRKPRSYAEVYNDLDGDVVNVFRVLRDEGLSQRLKQLLELTPFARWEFLQSYEASDDPVEAARRTLVRAFMSFGSTSRRKNRTGFRGLAYRQNQTGAQDWANYPEVVDRFTRRLKGVVIESKDALNLITQQDRPETLFYVDPPYPLGTRSSVRCASDSDRAYAVDMTDDDHRRLAGVLRGCVGKVVVSGYGCELYDRELFADWKRVAAATWADGARRRTEVLWMNFEPMGVLL